MCCFGISISISINSYAWAQNCCKRNMFCPLCTSRPCSVGRTQKIEGKDKHAQTTQTTASLDAVKTLVPQRKLQRFCPSQSLGVQKVLKPKPLRSPKDFLSPFSEGSTSSNARRRGLRDFPNKDLPKSQH